MQIDTGLFPFMVMQRNRADLSKQLVTGRCVANAKLSLRAEKDGRALTGFAKKSLRKADSKGRFSVSIDGLPVGGPYCLRLSANEETLQIDDVLVGDVWVLAGQSNMSGVGLVRNRETPRQEVRAYYMDDSWDIADEPIHQAYLSRYPAHGAKQADGQIEARGSRNAIKGVGPGLSFGLGMHERHGIPQGLIACAHGGTKLYQWKPVKSTTSLFGAMLDRIRLNGGKVAGLLWMQGASDTEPQARVDGYVASTKAIFKRFRQEVGPVPIVISQLGSVREENWKPNGWTAIREKQRLLPTTVKKLATIPVIDLPLDDLVHISALGHRVLGRRFAEAMDSLRYGKKQALPPIALKRISQERDPETKETLLRVHFDNVSGELQSHGNPSGFTFVKDGRDRLGVYRIDLDGSSLVIRHCLNNNDLQDATICYGYGLAPHCNIHDSEGRPLPCFGPAAVGPGYPMSNWAENMQASQLLPWPGSIEAAQLPGKPLSWQAVELMRFYNPILSMQNRSGDDHLVYFRCRFSCSEAMCLDALYDADGPAKLWLDGNELWCDPKCRNPIRPDAKKLSIKTAAGTHEIIVALGSNGGKACGICLRLARTDKNRAADGSLPAMPVLI